MQREIKFRGKRKDTGEWVTGYYWRMNDERNGNKACITVSNVGADDFFNYEVVPETVGQHIGWSDFNDVNVYEGDAIEIYWGGGKDDTTVEVISYDDFYGYFKYGNNPMCELKDPIKCFFVIGNLSDNPELNPLKGERINTMNNFDPNVKADGEVKDDAADLKAAPAEQEQVPAPTAGEAKESAEEGTTEG